MAVGWRPARLRENSPSGIGRLAVRSPTSPFPSSGYGKLRFSRSGNFLFAVALNNEWVTSTRIWQTGDWEEVALTGNQFAGLWSVDLSPDDRLLAAGYANGAVKLFRFPSGQHETTFTNHQAHGDGSALLAGWSGAVLNQL